jgi:putative hydrolase of the HAD superfamily
LFRIGLLRLGVPGDGAVMIGDSWDADIVGARNAGIRAIWFNRFGRDAPDGSDAPQIRAFDGTAFDLIAGTYAATARAA